MVFHGLCNDYPKTQPRRNTMKLSEIEESNHPLRQLIIEKGIPL
jgi:hypothetical protein